MDRKRNLDFDEIYDEVALINQQSEKIYGKRLSNIVFMGMGEPLANWSALSRALRRITEPAPAGLGIGQRHVTVSTVGLVPGIDRLIEADLQVTLAVSLHAPDDELRDMLVGINHFLAVVIAADREQLFGALANLRLRAVGELLTEIGVEVAWQYLAAFDAIQ